MNEQGGVFGWIREHPTMILVGALVAVFGAFFLKSKNTATTTPTTGDTSGLQTDSNGNPIIYRDVSDTFITKNIGSNNTTNNTTTNPAPPVVTGPRYPPPTAIQYPIEPTSETAYIRSKDSTPITDAYDANHTGIPIRDTPDGKIVRYQTFGTSVSITGAAVAGGSNLPKNGYGSTEWLPVAGGGYVSVFDVTGVQ